MDRFSPGISEKFGHYVYRHINPRDGLTFYVGRGQGDQVFAHASAGIETVDGPSPSFGKI